MFAGNTLSDKEFSDDQNLRTALGQYVQELQRGAARDVSPNYGTGTAQASTPGDGCRQIMFLGQYQQGTTTKTTQTHTRLNTYDTSTSAANDPNNNVTTSHSSEIPIWHRAFVVVNLEVQAIKFCLYLAHAWKTVTVNMF